MANCDYRCIELTGKNGKGKVAIVDVDTYEKYGHLAWHLSNWGYPMRRIGNRNEKKKTILLHRLVIGAKDGEIVDHKNRNRLDARRSNLRICTASDNAKNRSGVKGYSYDKGRNKWVVVYRHKFCGRFDTEEEAKRQYQLMKSGVEYKTQQRKHHMLPKGVMFMEYMLDKGTPYYVRPKLNGKRYFLGYFATIDEAKAVYDKFVEERKVGK